MHQPYLYNVSVMSKCLWVELRKKYIQFLYNVVTMTTSCGPSRWRPANSRLVCTLKVAGLETLKVYISLVDLIDLVVCSSLVCLWGRVAPGCVVCGFRFTTMGRSIVVGNRYGHRFVSGHR